MLGIKKKPEVKIEEPKVEEKKVLSKEPNTEEYKIMQGLIHHLRRLNDLEKQIHTGIHREKSIHGDYSKTVNEIKSETDALKDEIEALYTAIISAGFTEADKKAILAEAIVDSKTFKKDYEYLTIEVKK